VSVRSGTASVGSKAPDFRLADQHEAVFHLEAALASGPVVLVFLRGFA
jgi:peroxiredoxin